MNFINQTQCFWTENTAGFFGKMIPKNETQCVKLVANDFDKEVLPDNEASCLTVKSRQVPEDTSMYIEKCLSTDLDEQYVMKVKVWEHKCVDLKMNDTGLNVTMENCISALPNDSVWAGIFEDYDRCINQVPKNITFIKLEKDEEDQCIIPARESDELCMEVEEDLYYLPKLNNTTPVHTDSCADLYWQKQNVSLVLIDSFHGCDIRAENNQTVYFQLQFNEILGFKDKDCLAEFELLNTEITLWDVVSNKSRQELQDIHDDKRTVCVHLDSQ